MSSRSNSATSTGTLDQGPSRAAPPPVDGVTDPGQVGRAGLVAGVTLLLLAVLAAIGDLVVVNGLVTPGHAAKTATDILASESLFRFGVASLYLVVVLDIVAAWALFRFFAPVNPWLSRLSAWLRVAFAGVFLVATSQLAAVPALLTDPGHRAAFGVPQLQAEAMLKVEAFDHTWMAALLLFGAHLMTLGYLAYRSGYVPRLIGILLMVAGAGYAFDTFASVLSAHPVVISTYTFLGELLLAIWLVVRGRRVRVGTAADPSAPRDLRS